MTYRLQLALDVLRKNIDATSRFNPFKKSAPSALPDEVISTLMASNPADVIPRLAPLLYQSSPTLRNPLSDLMMFLAGRLPPEEWLGVDASIRLHSVFTDPKLEVRSSPHPAFALIGLCHPSGRVREEALGQVATLPPLLRTSLLLVRVNDWVRPVRRQAAALLPDSFQHLTAEDQMRLVPLLDRLRYCGRHENTTSLAAWRISLAKSLDEAAWLKCWARSNGKERRVYLEFLKLSGGVPGEAVRRELLKSNDRMALLWYMKSILPKLDTGTAEEAAHAISRSRAVPVRRVWLGHLVDIGSETVVATLKETLDSRSRSLRHFARYHLSRLEPLDFAAHYHALLDSPSMGPVALRGLAEVSPEAGHQEAILRLHSSDPAVRKAAMECLIRDELDGHIGTLLELAGGTTPDAGKARKLLTAVAAALGDHLEARPQATVGIPTNLKLHLIRTAPLFRKWQGLTYLLQEAFDPEFRGDAIRALGVWRGREGRAFLKLKEKHRAYMLDLLDQLALPGDLSDGLRFIVSRAES